MLVGKYVNALFGKNQALFWVGKTITGSMSLVCMDGKKALDTFGPLTVNKQPFLNLISHHAMANIQQ
jgi:hypothetical protein